MSFIRWLLDKTGMTLYDFRVLTWGKYTKEENETTVNQLFAEWKAERNPAESEIELAIKQIEEQGFEITTYAK